MNKRYKFLQLFFSFYLITFLGLGSQVHNFFHHLEEENHGHELTCFFGASSHHQDSHQENSLKKSQCSLSACLNLLRTIAVSESFQAFSSTHLFYFSKLTYQTVFSFKIYHFGSHSPRSPPLAFS